MSKVVLWRRGERLEVEREQVGWWTDRTRMKEGQKCARARWWKYMSGPKGEGLESAWNAEELVLGSATHLGLERVLKGDGVEEAVRVAREYVKEGRISWKDEWVKGTEVEDVLREEMAAMVEGFVRTWEKKVWPRWGEEFEVVEVEEEINWVLWEDEFGGGEDGLRPEYGVVMSRPDVVLKGREDGRLYAVSYKTTKNWGPVEMGRLVMDVQKLMEGWAVTEKWGEDCAGVLYVEFVKGGKYFDKGLGVERYTSPLVRPWMRRGVVGEIGPESFRMEWETKGEDGRASRLGSGWERVNVWEVVGMKEWVEWLEDGLVEGEKGRDWLAEMVATPTMMPWDREQAVRWRRGAEVSEGEWRLKRWMVEVEGVDGLDKYMPLSNEACWAYGRRCFAAGVCWEGESWKEKLVSGKWRLREVNHEQERGGGDEGV